jgi:hypothetical protein
MIHRLVKKNSFSAMESTCSAKSLSVSETTSNSIFPYYSVNNVNVGHDVH